MFQPTRRANFRWLGLVEYREALAFQYHLEEQVRSGRDNQILGLEHPHVVTLGKRSRLDPEIPRGNVVWVDRGGEATLHSEGQLVIYPIVNLTERYSVREWVNLLLETTEKTLSHYEIETQRGEHSGLWTSAGKIAFAGIRVRNRISTHGISINVCNDLGLFDGMKSCGVRQAPMDSCQKHGKQVQPHDVFAVWCLEFLRLTRATGAENLLIEREPLASFSVLSE